MEVWSDPWMHGGVCALWEIREQIAFDLVKPYRVTKILRGRKNEISIPGRDKIGSKAQSTEVHASGR